MIRKLWIDFYERKITFFLSLITFLLLLVFMITIIYNIFFACIVTSDSWTQRNALLASSNTNSWAWLKFGHTFKFSPNERQMLKTWIISSKNLCFHSESTKLNVKNVIKNWVSDFQYKFINRILLIFNWVSTTVFAWPNKQMFWINVIRTVNV